MKKYLKMTAWLIPIGLFIGLGVQVIWAIVFFNNDAMFAGHWMVALLGISAMWCGVPGLLFILNDYINS